MEYLMILGAGIIGLCLGSFINVVVLRLDKVEGIATGRSMCPHCKHALAWYDLIPVLSFVFLLGRCRYCEAKISIQYPAVELITAILCMAFAWRYGPVFEGREVFFFLGLLLFWTLFLFDLKYFILPDKIILLLALVALLYNSIFSGMLINSLITGGLSAGVFGILYIVTSGRGMGFGDVKLALAIGLFFGYPVAPAIIVSAIWTAAILGVSLIIFGRATMKSALPFGSFLAVSAMLALLLYDDIVFLKFLV